MNNNVNQNKKLLPKMSMRRHANSISPMDLFKVTVRIGTIVSEVKSIIEKRYALDEIVIVEDILEEVCEKSHYKLNSSDKRYILEMLDKGKK